MENNLKDIQMNAAIKVGDIVTVLEWNEVTVDSGFGLMSSTYKRRDRSYVGDELKIIAIDMPFVKVLRREDVITLNTNELKIKHLSQEFIEAGREYK